MEAASAAAAKAASTTPPSPTRMGAAGAALNGVAAADAPDGGGGNQEKKMDPVVAALRNASGLLLASIKAVAASLGPVIAGETGARKVRLGSMCVYPAHEAWESGERRG